MACRSPILARALEREQQLILKNQALRNYVDFLGKAYNRAFGFAEAHGYHASEADIEEGRRLRVLAGLKEWPGNG